ncbi:10198_t:CDS:1, partial [Funneliformis geosporum]
IITTIGVVAGSGHCFCQSFIILSSSSNISSSSDRLLRNSSHNLAISSSVSAFTSLAVLFFSSLNQAYKEKQSRLKLSPKSLTHS